MAKKFLVQNNIHFEERNVSVDYAAAQELQKRNIRGVPAFFVGDDVIVGFDQAKLLQLIDHRLQQCPQCSTKLRVPVNKGKLEVKCPKCATKFEVTT